MSTDQRASQLTYLTQHIALLKRSVVVMTTARLISNTSSIWVILRFESEVTYAQDEGTGILVTTSCLASKGGIRFIYQQILTMMALI